MEMEEKEKIAKVEAVNRQINEARIVEYATKMAQHTIVSIINFCN